MEERKETKAKKKGENRLLSYLLCVLFVSVVRPKRGLSGAYSELGRASDRMVAG
jgi:hypothetical protein